MLSIVRLRAAKIVCDGAADLGEILTLWFDKDPLDHALFVKVVDQPAVVFDGL
jgi:hypothetical protein